MSKDSKGEKWGTVTIIGAGNLAHHLGQRFFQQGISVNQVFSRKKRKAQRLAKLIKATATNQLSEIEDGAMLYVIAVSDSVIGQVAQQLSSIIDSENSLVVHTSGATPSTVLKGHFKHYGVFYPLQSFSIERKVDFTSIPVCIDAKYVRDKKNLEKLASLISNNTFTTTDEQRAILHVAAVFVNNFTNLMYRTAEDILEPKGLSMDILRPLLLETALKVQTNSPKDMQTGPAIRKDQATIDRHLSYLKKEHLEYYSIYLQLTEALFPEVQSISDSEA